MNTQSNLPRYIAQAALITVVLLSIPLIAGQFTKEVTWSSSDYILAGILLFGTGLTYKLVTNTSGSTLYRVAVGLALSSGLFLIWVNLAVGIVGSEDNLFNLIYFVLPFIGIIGAHLVRFKAEGLAKTMFAMAFAQTMVTVIALGIGMQELPVSSITKILGANGIFIVLFTVSAFLFHYAADKQPQKGAD